MRSLKEDVALFFELSGKEALAWALKCRKHWGPASWSEALQKHEARR